MGVADELLICRANACVWVCVCVCVCVWVREREREVWEVGEIKHVDQKTGQKANISTVTECADASG